MAFTQKHSDQNKAIKSASAQILQRLGYKPNYTDKLEIHSSVRKQLIDELTELFPDISEQRIKRKASSAMIRQKSANHNKRGAQIGNNNAQKDGYSFTVRIRVQDTLNVGKIRAMSTEKLGSLIEDAINK